MSRSGPLSRRRLQLRYSHLFVLVKVSLARAENQHGLLSADVTQRVVQRLSVEREMTSKGALHNRVTHTQQT
jgi:hypothetical protein